MIGGSGYYFFHNFQELTFPGAALIKGRHDVLLPVTRPDQVLQFSTVFIIPDYTQAPPSRETDHLVSVLSRQM